MHLHYLSLLGPITLKIHPLSCSHSEHKILKKVVFSPLEQHWLRANKYIQDWQWLWAHSGGALDSTCLTDLAHLAHMEEEVGLVSSMMLPTMVRGFAEIPWLVAEVCQAQGGENDQISAIIHYSTFRQRSISKRKYGINIFLPISPINHVFQLKHVLDFSLKGYFPV